MVQAKKERELTFEGIAAVIAAVSVPNDGKKAHERHYHKLQDGPSPTDSGGHFDLLAAACGTVDGRTVVFKRIIYNAVEHHFGALKIHGAHHQFHSSYRIAHQRVRIDGYVVAHKNFDSRVGKFRTVNVGFGRILESRCQ